MHGLHLVPCPGLTRGRVLFSQKQKDKQLTRYEMMIAQLDNGRGPDGVEPSLQPVYAAVRLMSQLYDAGLITYKVDAYATLKEELTSQLAVLAPHWAERVGQLSLFDRRQMVEIPGLE